MNLKSLGPEQVDQIQACQSADEFRVLVESEQIELMDDLLLKGEDNSIDWEATHSAINELLADAAL